MSQGTPTLGPLPDGSPIDAGLWLALNRAVIAKAISELAFEEGLAPEPANAEGTQWILRFAGGVAYRFKAVRRIWGNLSIDAASLMRQNGAALCPADDAAGFMLDARETLDIEPDTLCIYAKELFSTLLADARIATMVGSGESEHLLTLPDDQVQAYLDGHPKAPASKGRIGWGLSDFSRYAPEFQPTFQLFWLAADRSRCRLSLAGDIDEEALLAASLGEAERERLQAACKAAGLDPNRFMLLPVHPWQWDNMIVAQFAGEMAAGRIVPLGLFGDAYRPLQSLRTLANAASPAKLHLKLSLTILNTSAWRGVPGKYMTIGPAFSNWLADKARQDPELANALVLRECAGAFYPHPLYERVADAPYQFREMLGVIWRESPEAGLAAGRRPLMLGALIKSDFAGVPLASALIAASGLSHAEWLARLFDAVVLPLYHFLCRYGVGFIAHGQNITVLLDGAIPYGVALKDLQGDVDLVDQAFAEAADLEPAIRDTLLKRPAAHLLQHLQTGHFASVLRFLSDTLASHDRFPEIEFYGALAQRLRLYQARHPDLADRFELFDLFTPKVPRICINRVRLAIGYGDANRRPVPSLGSELDNPLHLAERESRPLRDRGFADKSAGVQA
ncbi:IucA/IucC family siderophore biosynthesis protein [Labrys neptuniae]|uniref:IucA/IucC family protein n=1 Tax=Labrys neptuniae TaxID=376174 RepID=UPI002892719B|nr:IucA/IucC family siderophore biosynthesis protein [Labrys neptuniae]MDT3375814.1 IucA/IucC family siderophore biosynthesis protein [Labrys neptuniae]